MNSFPRAELIAFRVRQAEDTLEQAQLLHAHEHYSGAVNRAYYAMFYAIQAVITTHAADVSKHAGAIAFFDQYIVKEGKIDTEFSRWLHWLFDLRQDADYGTSFCPTAAHSQEAIEHASKLVEEIKTKIHGL